MTPEDPSQPPNPYLVTVSSDDQLFPVWQRFLRLGWIVAAVAVLAAGFIFVRRRQPEIHTVVKFAPVSQWTSDPGLSIAPVFSRDGKIVVYASDREGPGNLNIWLGPYPSGAHRQLTQDQFNQTDPDISPDGSLVVFHSDRDGGGIYIVPVAAGGQPRLLAKGGLRPRFSANGRWIAYYTISSEDNQAQPLGAGRIYIVPPEGGVTKRIRPDFPYARSPVWSPEGELLLFEGTNDEGSTDWWVTPIYTGDATRTHAFERLNIAVATHSAPERWEQDRILFAAAGQTTLQIWELGISRQNWQPSRPPAQLTAGQGIEEFSVLGPDGRIMFTSMRLSVDIWSLPLDGNTGKATGALKRITDDHGLNQAPSVSDSKMAYISDRTGFRDIWVNDLETGAERAVTAFQYIGYRPVLSPDGNRVAFRTTLDNHCALLVADLNLARGKAVASGCFNIWDWSPDGSSLLIYSPGQASVSAEILKVDSGQRQPLLSSPRLSLLDAGFSRDGKWIAFSAGATLPEAEVFIAPLHGGPIRETEWIPITHGGGSLSAWSPNGGVLYFHSQRDGFRCIWAQQLDGAKRPIGDPFAVQHFHSVAFGMYMIKPVDFHMSVTRNRMVLNLATETANLWVTAKSE